ncbi:DUF6587 family protein [Lysobacter humi (ex Lee et al. 2017)]
MQTGQLLQHVLVALAVLASGGYVLHDRMPTATRRMRGWVALRCIDAGPAWLHRIGLRLAPPVAAGGACGGCNGCGTRN